MTGRTWGWIAAVIVVAIVTLSAVPVMQWPAPGDMEVGQAPSSSTQESSQAVNQKRADGEAERQHRDQLTELERQRLRELEKRAVETARRSRPVEKEDSPSVECPGYELNDFDWPPPEPSTKVTIPRILVVGDAPEEQQTLGEVGRRLEHALVDSGYVEYGYQSIGCSGFVLVTRLERIDPEGRPLQGGMRFAPPEAESSWSLSDYIAKLFYAPPGYYRQIVFAATDKPYEEQALAARPSREELDEMLARADVTAVPPSMAGLPFSSGHRLFALVYELEKGEGDGDVRQTSRLSGAAHVRAAGIYSSLAGEGRDAS